MKLAAAVDGRAGALGRIDVSFILSVVCSLVQIWVPPPASLSICLLISLPHWLRDVIGGTQASWDRDSAKILFHIPKLASWFPRFLIHPLNAS